MLAFVVERLGMIEMAALHMGGGARGKRPEVGGERFRIAPLDSFIALPQGFLDDVGHRLSGGLSDGLGKPVGFRVFDVEARGASFFLYHWSTFLYSSSFPDSLPGHRVPYRSMVSHMVLLAVRDPAPNV